MKRQSDGGPVDVLLSQFPFVLAVCAGSGLAHMGTSTMPFQVGALIEGAGRTASQAGLFGFFQVGALALGMVASSNWIDRFDARFLAIGSAVLSAGASAALFVVHEFLFQLLFGAMAGLGFGLIFASTIASVAGSDEADRLYAIGNGGALVVIIAVVGVLPAFTADTGSTGIFLGISMLSLACAPFFVGFRSAMRPAHRRGHFATWQTPGAVGLLFSWTSFSLGTAAVYAFSERVGHSINLAPKTIGVVLSVGILVGIAGSMMAAVLGRQCNRRVALVVGMIGCALACAMLGLAENLAMYVCGVFLYWVAYMFLYSYLLGTAALLDASGRVGTLGGGMERMGNALGAWVGGILADHISYNATGMLGCAMCVLGLAVGYPSLFRSLRRLENEAGADVQIVASRSVPPRSQDHPLF